MNKISSACAVELMTLGATMDDIDPLCEKAAYLQSLAGDFRLDRDAAIANLAKSPDAFREIYVMDKLAQAGIPDLNAANLTGCFAKVLDRLSESRLDGVNLYLGRASLNRMATYLARSTEFISRKIEPDLVPYIMEPVAKALENTVFDEMAAYKADFLDSEEALAETMDMLKTSETSDFIRGLSARLLKTGDEIGRNLATLKEHLSETMPLFSSREVDSAEHYAAVNRLFGRFRENGLRSSYSVGIKRHGAAAYGKRLAAAREQLDGFFSKPHDAVKLAARIAAGPSQMPDFRLLPAYVAKTDPIPYNIPKDIQTDQKLAALAAEISRDNADIGKVCEGVVKQIEADPLLQCVADRNPGPCVSAYAMIARNIANESRWGSDDEAAQFAADLAEKGKRRAREDFWM